MSFCSKWNLMGKLRDIKYTKGRALVKGRLWDPRSRTHWVSLSPPPAPGNPGDSASKLAHLRSYQVGTFQDITYSGSYYASPRGVEEKENTLMTDYFIENFYDGKCQIFKTRENPCTHATEGSTSTKSRPVSFCFSPTHSHTPADFLKSISKYITICSKILQHCLSKKQRFWESRPPFRYHTKKIKTLAP